MWNTIIFRKLDLGSLLTRSDWICTGCRCRTSRLHGLMRCDKTSLTPMPCFAEHDRALISGAPGTELVPQEIGASHLVCEFQRSVRLYDVAFEYTISKFAQEGILYHGSRFIAGVDNLAPVGEGSGRMPAGELVVGCAAQPARLTMIAAIPPDKRMSFSIGCSLSHLHRQLP